MRIINALVFGKDRCFNKENLRIEDGFFTEDKGDPMEEILDMDGCYALPGFVDIHLHGALGYDVCDMSMEAFERIAEYEAFNGVTGICPATLTLPVSMLKDILGTGAGYKDDCRNDPKKHEKEAELLGFNMEGPFISMEKKGAQNGAYIIKCDKEITEEFFEASKGLLKITGLAPEVNPGFPEYIKALKDKVRISLAHTGADNETASLAFEAGACHVVHLFNAMGGFSARSPGIFGALSDHKEATAELICDGIHVHPSMVRAAFSLYGGERMIIISDSLRCTGMPDGEYELGGLKVVKSGRLCTLKDDGTIAGSVSVLHDCFRRAVLEMGIPVEEAASAVTINPARRIGEENRAGVIEKGRKADLVLLSKDDLEIKAVFLRGKRIR